MAEDILTSIDTALLRATITKAHIATLYTQLESGIEIPDEPMVTLLKLNQRATLLKTELDKCTRGHLKTSDAAQSAKLESGLMLPSEAVGLKPAWEEMLARRSSLKRAYYSVLADSEAPALLVAEPFAVELEAQADAVEGSILGVIEAWPVEASAGSLPTILRLSAQIVREAAAGPFVPPATRVFWCDLSDFEDLLQPS
jgi:hypothetical protein